MSSYQKTAPVPSQEFLDRNAKYAEGHKPELGNDHWGHVRPLAVITCMDSRIYPHEQLGLGVNDTAIIRNAGGSVAEVLTTILACQKFGVRHFMVLKHTDCGGFRLQGREIIEHYKAHAKSNPTLSAKTVEEVTSEIREFGYGNTPIEEVVLNDVEFFEEESVDL
ncbi:hypothetical protein K435DRAFT_963748 [Dendrothele bispora CBS 962.96]|uniref:Carbonic anhydrase n=1 Tax=Dendrothele bispora (strain CBS 962.96) TaxID=1314807 RepID=A0A4S8MEP4_DENBC|nr:hypothetical protein K435DRAFT_963748 [Dendrothele bispora CBS 962.96]